MNEGAAKTAAASSPADKLRLVEALQKAGHVVAVTGDGINDTPALRRADVGVAMGRSGTEAAREAADVVLTDDDFATIVTAIGEGRRIAQNIRNFVAFLLSANLGEVVLFAVAILAGIGAPMTVVQVLTVNLLTDGLPAIALTRDPASAPTLRSRPRGQGTLFPRPLQLALLLMGMAVGLTATAAYVIGRATEPEAAQTMAFVTLATAELILVFSIRSGMSPAWQGPRNSLLVSSVLVSLMLLVLSIYLAPLRNAFGTDALSGTAVAIVIGLAIAPAALRRPRKPSLALAAGTPDHPRPRLGSAVFARKAYPHSSAIRFSALSDGGSAAVSEAPRKVTADRKETVMKKWFAYGGVAASVILVAFGIGAIVIGATGLNTVRDEIAAQKITATDDAAELTNGRLQPGQEIKTGAEARAFADIMEHHTLESTEGKRYAEMGRFLTADGKDTSDEALAAKGPDGRPVENGLRNMWVTETALTTALNTSFFAERVAYFSIVMGVALLLTGIGFLVLTLGGGLGYIALPKRQKKLDTASAAT